MGLFRRLFGAKKPDKTRSDNKERKRWSFTRSSNPASSTSHIDARDDNNTLDANKHAIAVAAATAAVAEAALAAAHAAAEVVRLTSGSGGGGGGPGGSNRRLAQQMAVVRIQSAFRGYLARRALRALKALVKLQALVRGHIVRKQTADMLKRMQTMVRLQARARASRSHVTRSLDTIGKLSRLSRNAVRATSGKDECQHRASSTKYDRLSILKRCGSNSNLKDIIDLQKARTGSSWLDQSTEESLWNNRRDAPLIRRHADDEKSAKILEVDTWKPHMNSHQSRRNFRLPQHFSSLDYNQSFTAYDSPRKPSGKASNPIPNISSAEVLSFSPMKNPGGKDEAVLRTADNSPQVLSASSRPGSSARRSPFTPTGSEYSWGYLSGYSGHPNYMANTESSRAKYRSQSAPRQRLEFDKYSSTRRTVQGLWDSGANSEIDFPHHVDFSYGAHPSSNSLNRPGSANQRE